ncbi:hypothetical protein GCM10010505_77210 [Kitasatospora aburaviensis]
MKYSPARSLLARLPVSRWLTPADAATAAGEQGMAVALRGDTYMVDGVSLASAIRHGRRTGRVVTRSDGAFFCKPEVELMARRSGVVGSQ